VHDVIPLVFPNYFPAGIKGYINLYFQKRALRKADAVICDSNTSKTDIIEKLSINKNIVHKVYLAPSQSFKPATDSKALQRTAEKYKLPKKFALYVGDVNWNKNVLNILEASKLSKVPLVLAGKAFNEDIPEARKIKNKIKKLNISKNVTITGYVSEQELVCLYNLASVTLMPSYYEGFGLPVLESMACGTPVVCSNVASLSEIGLGAAIFCDPTSPEDIASKIKKVFNLSDKKRDELTKKSINHAKKFTWQKTVQETVKVYKSLSK
jgi:glycosyltransferase involved in cell wall biosynthesis